MQLFAAEDGLTTNQSGRPIQLQKVAARWILFYRFPGKSSEVEKVLQHFDCQAGTKANLIKRAVCIFLCLTAWPIWKLCFRKSNTSIRTKVETEFNQKGKKRRHCPLWANPPMVTTSRRPFGDRFPCEWCTYLILSIFTYRNILSNNHDKKPLICWEKRKRSALIGFVLTQNAFVETAIYQLLRGNAFPGMTASQIRNSMYHRKCKYVGY